MNEKQEKILKEYEERRSIYEAFTEYCKNELLQFIKENALAHLLDHVSGRPKQVSSLQQKLLDGMSFERLEKCRDLAGIRAVFYVDSAISIFVSRIMLDGSIRSLECKFLDRVYDVPHFLRQHAVLKVSEEALARYPELKRFEGLLCELQVRDTLQNAWANIYHETMYKRRKVLEKDFAEDMAIIDQRYESMVQGPLQEVSNSINYLYKVGLELSQGQRLFSADVEKQVRSSTDIAQVWDVLNDLENHIRVFGPKFHDNDSIIRTLEEIHSRLETFSALGKEKQDRWLFDDVMRKVISITCELFYLLPEKVCQLLEILIEQRASYHREIVARIKTLINYHRNVISRNGYAPQLFLAQWVARANSKNSAARRVWLSILDQFLEMELSGVLRSDVELFSIERGILPFHTQLVEVRKVCFETLYSMLATELKTNVKVELIRQILRALRPSFYYEQFEAQHRAIYENELISVVAYFDSCFDAMSTAELIVLDVEGEELAFWFGRNALDIGCWATFRKNRLQRKGYLAVRTFVGHERHVGASEDERIAKLSALVNDISEESWPEKLGVLCQVATLYPDLGHGEFDVFEDFLEHLAAEKSSLAFDLLKNHIIDLGWSAKCLIPNLYLSTYKAEVVSFLQKCIENRVALEAIVHGFSFIRPAPMALTSQLLDVLLQTRETHLVYVVISSLQAISGNWDREQMKQMFFKCIEFLSLQRHFRWVDHVFYEDNSLFNCFEFSDFERVLKLLTGVDHVCIGIDYVLSKVASQDSCAVLQFFEERRKICVSDVSMQNWPSYLQRTQSVLGKLELKAMQAFYAVLRKGSDCIDGDFVYRLLPQLLSLSALSLSEMIGSVKNNAKELSLLLRILQQYPDDPAALGHYKCILSKCKLSKSQVQVICSQLTFVGQCAGREGRLNQLQARQSIVNAWGTDQKLDVKTFLLQFNKAMDTAIKDEQAEVSRERFNDTAAFQDGDCSGQIR